MTFINIPRPFAIVAAHQLAKIDYNVATRISDDVSNVIEWSYNHHLPWLAESSMHLLQNLDSFGSFIIAIVAWIIYHTN